MDAVKYLKERARMLKNGQGFAIRAIESSEDIERAVEIVEQWSKAHPQKTQVDLFFERYPNAPTYDYGLPITRPCEVGFTSEMACAGNCAKCRKDYWFKPVEG